MNFRLRWRHDERLAALFILGCAAALLPASPAAAKEKVLYSFSGSDGAIPNGIMLDGSGTLYGTTSLGGVNGNATNGGVVFQLVPNGSGYDFSVLYNFCSLANCADGSIPVGQPLIEDTSGDLYGITESGGKYGAGTAFELSPGKNGWKLGTLYNFCRRGNARVSCRDGRIPVAGLTYQGADSGALYDGTSPLYGATANGGKTHDGGVVYQLSFVDGQKTRDETVLHAFCKLSSCPDGTHPSGGLLVDSNGRLYGVTLQGGNDTGSGVIYRLGFNATKNRWEYKRLYVFCTQAGCPDGRVPLGTLVMDRGGSLFGAAELGGAFANGTVFQFSLKNSQQTTLYSFCADQNTCTDGSMPSAGVILDNSGNLFGVAQSGGFGFDEGVAFELSGGTETVLYDFCKLSGCTDGRLPEGNIARDSSGNLFGVTQTGGNNSGTGAVFELTAGQ